MKVEDGEVHEIDRKESMEIENPIEMEEEESRDLSTQEIIDGLEALIKKIDSATSTEEIPTLKKAVVLILKILSVEFNKQIELNPQISGYFS